MKTMITQLKRDRLFVIILTLFALFITAGANAQCSNWGITARLINASSCTGNGSFKVTLTGPDTANLSGIQFGIPINANGFAVPLNNSTTFTGIPPGNYTVSAVALCGGNYVGKNTTIIVPGNYVPPTLNLPTAGATVPCRNTGSVVSGINNGLGPFTARLNNANTGVLVATSTSSSTFVNFSNLPAGDYNLSVLDICGSGTVPVRLTVNTSYPFLTPYIRQTLTCKNTGAVSGSISGGVPPFTLRLSLGGQLINTQTNRTPGFIFENLGAGNYDLSLIDSCGSQYTASYVIVDAVNPVAMPLVYPFDLHLFFCDSFTLRHPYLPVGVPAIWNSYYTDTSFKMSMQISGGLLPATPFIGLNQIEPMRALAAGKSPKDYYGKTITYLLKHPCGIDTIYSQAIPYPNFAAGYQQHCGLDMSPTLFFTQNVCYPITYSMQNVATGVTYGPFTQASPGAFTAAIPYGNYSISYRTADGYNGTGSLNTVPGTGNPYSVFISSAAKGFHNYVDYFDFYTSAYSGRNVQIELFNGPGGYTFRGSAYASASGGLPFARIHENQTPGTGSVYFPPGNYVWKLTDDCGTYFIPITVTTHDLYQFTVDAALEPTCIGLKVTPSGTARYRGVNTPVYFSLLLNGQPINRGLPGGGYVWDKYPAGSSVYITEPGKYTILTSAEPNQQAGNLWMSYFFPFEYPNQYPNPYTKTYSFTYEANYLKVDVNKSQGFACIGDGAGQGKIYAQGQGGIPFRNPPAFYYKYSLARQGQGATGPYIAQNTTGIFTGFGASSNNTYDVKVEDTCGASAVQSLKILDLANTRLITSNHYSTCALDSIQLSAIYLPNATYSWTGPNGFTSTLRTPVISRATLAAIGVYYVTITTTVCNGAIKDSTILSLNANPPKPVAAVNCDPDLVSISVTNPSPGMRYAWSVGTYFNSGARYSERRSDTLNTKWIYDRGNYIPVAIDSVTGCKSYGDTTFLPTDPNYQFDVSIYSPHLKLCTGDATTLVAWMDSSVNIFGSYQWYKNNVAIPGATGVSIAVNTAGNYRVVGSALPCRVDTSAVVEVSVVPPPTATITAPILQICEGDTAYISGNTSAGYQYTWHLDNSTIPGRFSAILPAYKTGDYYATISNGACVANSNSIHITVNPAPVVNLLPNTDQYLCSGGSVSFSTTANSAYTYVWQRDGVAIFNAQSNIYTTNRAGTYRVIVSSPTCANVISASVRVIDLPNGTSLGNDTTICNSGPFALALAAGTGFDTYRWSDGQTVSGISVSQAGTYWVVAANKCGTFTDTIHIHTADEYLPHFPQDTLICNAANLMMLKVPALLEQVHWSTGSTSATIAINQPGIYWVAGTSPCGPVSDTIKVQFCPPVINTLNLSKDSICEGDCIRITATTGQYPQTFQWEFTGTTPDTSNFEVPGQRCYPNAGIYPITLKVTNAGGSDTYTGQIIVLKKPAPRFADTSFIVTYKADLSLPACATAQKIDWYRDGLLVCSNCTTLNVQAKDYRTVYHCVVSNGDCMDSCVYKMQVIDIPHDVWLPDAFTPNGDGRNDAFHIITDNPNVYGVDLIIYNRWGQRLYLSHTTTDGWDGRINGAAADMGTYFWTLKYKVLGTEETFFKKGNLTLVR